MLSQMPLSEIVQCAAKAHGCDSSEALHEKLKAAGYDFTLAAVHSWWIGRYVPQRQALVGLADFFGLDGDERLALYEARIDYAPKAHPPRRRKRARAA